MKTIEELPSFAIYELRNFCKQKNEENKSLFKSNPNLDGAYRSGVWADAEKIFDNIVNPKEGAE